MGMAPESISRLMTNADEFHKISGERLHQFADILGASVDDLRRPPRPKDQPKPQSADELLKDEPEDVKLKAIQMIEILIGRKSA